MGGRGASSSDSSIKAVRISFNDNTETTYRTQKNGYISDINGDNYQKTNRSIKQIIQTAKENGYTVKTYTQSQLKEYDRQRAENRKKNDKELDNLYRTRGASTMKRRGFVK